MKRRSCEILEDEDQIELLEAELHTFQRRNLDIRKCNYQEWRIGQMDQTVGRWLEANIRSEWNALK